LGGTETFTDLFPNIFEGSKALPLSALPDFVN
jgi:hypothetical protein